jgi:hypothetical protein
MPAKIIFGLGKDMLQREGLGDTPEVWEDGLRADTGRGSFEWWYFDAHFDDGSTLVVVYFTKPILNRNAPLMPGITLTITRPDGEKISQFLTFSPEEFTSSRERCQVRIGSSYVQGDLKNYHLYAAGEGLAADLELQGVVPAWRPGTGKNYYDDRFQRYFAWLAAIPHGRVSGTLTYEGKTHAVQGACYHDHNWGNVGLETVLSYWYWGRAHVEDFTLIFVEMTANRKYSARKIPVFMLAKGHSILVGDGRPLQMEARGFKQHPGGCMYPQEVKFNWHDSSGQVLIDLSDMQIIEATSLLGTLSTWKRWGARLLGLNPYYFRFNAGMNLFIDLPGEKARMDGRALYEIMLLR